MPVLHDMPRNHNPGTLRNRNRITNKTRLKIIHGNVEADPFGLEEDEEKARVISTAGVDAEDANEHHLQVVLSATSHRNQPSSLRPRGDKPKDEAYIPIPDFAGVVPDAEKLYPPNRWKDPANYVRSSDTIDDAIDAAINGGFTYYMDERDHEWLEKNNEEARGEGTSAQGALSSPGLSRSRSAKAKGKEPDVPSPTSMNEDEFELIMGIFEKVTHEKTEFLHHSLETGMTFPPYSDYVDTFTTDIPPSLFSSYTLPPWLPPPPRLSALSQVVYPYWKERRIERGGHRIIPILNYDESDLKNESYICFRRREVKQIRKTRASQVSVSDKLHRLQAEMSVALELAQSLLHREGIKRESAELAQQVWQKRVAFVDLKRKFSQLGTKEDEDLLVDKERVVKKVKQPEPARQAPRIQIPRLPENTTSTETALRPRERYQQIQISIDRELARIKEKDQQHWEDSIDNPYQSRPVPYPERLYKYIGSTRLSPSHLTSSSEDEDTPHRDPHALRLRAGRGGRMHLDRRRPPPPARRSRAEFTYIGDDGEEAERQRRFRERWMFDEDDGPALGPDGPDEHDRVLVDDFQVKHLVHSMTLLRNQDHHKLETDPNIIITTDGQQKPTIPAAIRVSQALQQSRPLRPQPMGPPAAVSAAQVHPSMVTPQIASSPAISAMKKMQPVTMAQLRLSQAQATMRPPMMNALPAALPSGQTPASVPVDLPSTPSVGINGATSPTKSPSGSIIDGTGPSEMDSQSQHDPPTAQVPLRQKSPNKQIVLPNGFHVGGVNGYPTAVPNSAAATAFPAQVGHTSFTAQQIQEMKQAYAAAHMNAEMNNATAAGRPTYPTHLVNGSTNFNLPLGNANFNLKLPTSRQMQWASGIRAGNAGSAEAPNAATVAALLGQNNGMANLVAMAPVRVPSANGSMRTVTPAVAQMMNATGRASPATHLAHLAASTHASVSLSPHMHAASASPVPGSMMTTPQGSPPRPITSPIPPSPSLQHQPLVHNGTGVGGY